MARKKAERKQEATPVSQYMLEFKPKVDRAMANLGENHTEDQLLAEYDRLGGLITYEGMKVKTGSFWDKNTKAPVENPNPIVMRKQEIVEESVEEVKIKHAAKKTAKKTTKKAE